MPPPEPVTAQQVLRIRFLLTSVGKDEDTTCRQMRIEALERLSRLRAGKLIERLEQIAGRPAGSR